jgi:hypothetical protein
MKPHALPRKSFRYGFVALLMLASGLVLGQRSALGQALTIDFTQSGVDINSAIANSALNNLTVTSANSGAVETFDVWFVITPGASGATNSQLGLLNSYWGARSTVANSSGFTIPAGNATGASTAVGATFTGSAYASPFQSVSSFTSGEIGDRNTDGINDISSLSVKSSTTEVESNGGTTAEFGNGSNGGEALTGTNAGWAWEVATVKFTLPTINSTGTGTITLTPSVATFATNNAWTFNGGTSFVSNSSPAGGADATQIGSAITFTATPSSGGGNTSILTLKPTSTASPNTATSITFTPTTGTGYLVGATVPTQTMTLTETGGSATTYSTSGSPTGFTVTDNGTPPNITANGSDTFTVALNTSAVTPTTQITTPVSFAVTNTGGSSATQGNLSVQLIADVGNATPDKTATGTFTGTVLTASVANTGLYTGLSSSSNGGTLVANGTLPGIEGTTATILLGTNNQGSTMTPSMTWRSRMVDETSANDSVAGTGFVNGVPTSPPLPGGKFPLPLISDVVDLFGMSAASAAPTGSTTGTVAPVQTDPFAFEMNFNPKTLNAEGATGTAMASHGNLYLASLVPISSVANWENTIIPDFAVSGGTTAKYGPPGGSQLTIQVGSSATAAMDTGNPENATSGTFNYPLLESFAAFQSANSVTAANLANFVGVWGVDTTNDEAWAVVNHNSEFAVVPEPSAIVLAIFGVLGGICVMRRRGLSCEA